MFYACQILIIKYKFWSTMLDEKTWLYFYSSIESHIAILFSNKEGTRVCTKNCRQNCNENMVVQSLGYFSGFLWFLCNCRLLFFSHSK